MNYINIYMYKVIFAKLINSFILIFTDYNMYYIYNV